MPALRGIEARVVTQSQIGNLPEFPHPDGLSYQLQPDTLSVDYASHEQTMVEATQPTGHIPKTNSTVSVYVPSLPGLFRLVFPMRYCLRLPRSVRELILQGHRRPILHQLCRSPRPTVF